MITNDAWLRLVNYEGSGEYLQLCSEALEEVQRVHAHRLAEKQRAFAAQEAAHLRSTSATVYVQGIRDAADLIDPEKEET